MSLETSFPANDRLRWFFRFLPAILVTLLLFCDFGNSSVRIYDEGHFLLAGNTITLGVFGLLKGEPLSALSQQIHQNGGTLFFAAKPGHVGLMAFAGLFGRLTAWKALFLMALLGIGTVVLIQLIAERWYGKECGWLGGLSAACCPLLLEYSKTALSPVSSLFFAVLTLWLLQQPSRRLLFHVLAGFAAAAAVLCHYNTLPLLFAIMVSHLHRCRPRDVAGALLGGLCFLLLAEGALLFAGKLLSGVYPEFRSFFGELIFNLNKNHLSGKVFHQFEANALVTDGFRGYTMEAYWNAGKWLLTGFSLPLVVIFLGLYRSVFFKHSEGESFFPSADSNLRIRSTLAWLILFPLVIWLLYPWKIERNFVQCIPGVALLFPPMVRSALRLLSPKLIASVAIAVCLTGLIVRFPIRERSPIEELIRINRTAFEALPEESINAESFPRATSPLWKWYLGPEQTNTGNGLQGIDFASFDEKPAILTTDYSSPNQPTDYQPWGKTVLDPEHQVPWQLWIKSSPAPEHNSAE